MLIGTNYHCDGLFPDFVMPENPDDEGVAMLKAGYEGGAVDPAHWPVFYAKATTLFREEPRLSVTDLRSVTTPTLVLAGDDDCIIHAHTIELFENIADAQLAIVPGTSHVLLFEKPTLVNQLILDFLAETAPPGTLLPMRRASHPSRRS